jgi:hypothetical protein
MAEPTVQRRVMLQRKERRVERLRQQLQLLEAMDSSLWWKAIFCSFVIVIASVAAVVGLLFLLEKMPEASTLIYAGLAVVTLILTVRFWNPILWSIFILSLFLGLAFLFDDVFSPGDGDMFDGSGTGTSSASNILDLTVDEKSKHRLRVERAIEKCKRKLENLLARH